MPYEGRETGDRPQHEELRQVDLGELHVLLRPCDNIPKKVIWFEASFGPAGQLWKKEGGKAGTVLHSQFLGLWKFGMVAVPLNTLS
jgi:hypothetical protein